MERILSDEEIRHLVISTLTAPSERDKQIKAGASDLANGCDRCVARTFAGVHYETVDSRRTWMGARIGTALHKMMEPIADRIPGAKAEDHVLFGHISGYGDVGGTIDLRAPLQIKDWKGSTRKKLALLRDYIAINSGEEHRFWEKQKDSKTYEGGYKFTVSTGVVASLSNRAYKEEMTRMAHKVTSYYGQAQLYMRGCPEAVCASLVFIARDGNGWYEVADLPGYDDPTKKHDIFVLTFARNDEYANSIMERAQSLWDRIDGGEPLSGFAMHPDCFMCKDIIKREAREAQMAADAQQVPGEPVLVPIDMEVAA